MTSRIRIEAGIRTGIHISAQMLLLRFDMPFLSPGRPLPHRTPAPRARTLAALAYLGGVMLSFGATARAQTVPAADGGAEPAPLSAQDGAAIASPAPAVSAEDAGAIAAELAPVQDAAPAPSAAPPGAAGLPPAVEVQVSSAGPDPGRRLQRSSAAVLVVDAREAQAEASDLGSLLSRQQGVTLQRAGGLGSSARISLQGLGADQIRLYTDGVPLAFSGLPENLIYVPVDLVSRLELYRGVVPAIFGGDTLGGAIHLVSPGPEPGVHGSASLSLGSFDTQRAAVRAQVYDAARGPYASFSGFLDHAQNDYGVTADVGQPNGKKAPREVHRLHDGYRAGFGQVELGLLGRPYAEKLVLRAFASAYDKEINHDVAMNNPYGEVLSRRRSQGAILFYENGFSKRFALDAKLGYARRTRQLRDLSRCAYDWYHDCIAELPNGGEILGLPLNRKTEDHNVYLRAQAALTASKYLQFRLSAAPSFTRSLADDVEVPDGQIDLFDQRRRLSTLTLGLEHELDALRGKLENVAFVKDYMQWATASGETVQGPFDVEQRTHRVGVGDALRARLHATLLLKLSYELGTRLPALEELFGDGGFVDANLRLSPEVSHNANAELRWEHTTARAGDFALSAMGFARKARDLIVLLAGPSFFQYENVADARVLGGEAGARWSAPAEYARLDGSVTYQDSRNQSTEGPFARFEGARIPNRPYLFGNLSATGKLRGVVASDDALSLTFRETYVHAFFRAWENIGAQDKDEIPRQLVSSLILTYEMSVRERTMTADIEAHNLTDAKVYDFFGVQRPGRYVLAKLMFRI